MGIPGKSYLSLLIAAVLCPLSFCFGQKADSTRAKADTTTSKTDTLRGPQILEAVMNGKVSQKLVKSFTRKSTEPQATVRSEDYFMPHEGKIVRKIHIRQLGFERSVIDTARTMRSRLARLANKLHSNSRDWLIRDNLFIRENKPMNPYRMADNERYLRDLDFILDAKFYVLPLAHSEDSIDVIVMTRDVFSIGGSFSPRSPTKTIFRLYDHNLFGFGQRVQFTGLVDEARQPAFGYEFIYRKNSIGGSFVTGTAGYTQVNTGSSYGKEEEKAYFIRLDRPLVSPYTRFAGGMEVSRNWSHNVYQVNDTLFRNYRYIVNDFWVGYNLGAGLNYRDRNRHFFAIRAFEQHFTRRPGQSEEQTNPIYSNRTFLLGGLTFFKQNFYTARYIYGFGRTEDLPYGHTMSVYLGWGRQLGAERPYMGLDFGKSLVSPNGQFYNLLLRAGAFNNNGLEDAVVLFSGSLTSRLISYRKLLIRQFFAGDITHVFNQRTTLPLDINNEFGLRGFSADSLWGTKRFHISSETLAFTPLQIIGFRFAPFVYSEMAWLAPEHKSMFEDDPYFGIGTGLRTRNENLVFGTVELRIMYYPRTVNDMSSFNIRVSSNLRVKYSASFVRPPSFVTYN